MSCQILWDAFGDGLLFEHPIHRQQLWWTFLPSACQLHAPSKLATSVVLCCLIKLHIFEWPFVASSFRPTWAIIMPSNQQLDMPYLCAGWIISGEEKPHWFRQISERYLREIIFYVHRKKSLRRLCSWKIAARTMLLLLYFWWHFSLGNTNSPLTTCQIDALLFIAEVNGSIVFPKLKCYLIFV